MPSQLPLALSPGKLHPVSSSVWALGRTLNSGPAMVGGAARGLQDGFPRMKRTGGAFDFLLQEEFNLCSPSPPPQTPPRLCDRVGLCIEEGACSYTHRHVYRSKKQLWHANKKGSEAHRQEHTPASTTHPIEFRCAHTSGPAEPSLRTVP